MKSNERAWKHYRRQQKKRRFGYLILQGLGAGVFAIAKHLLWEQSSRRRK